jgi:hypothetical protein
VRKLAWTSVDADSDASESAKAFALLDCYRASDRGERYGLRRKICLALVAEGAMKMLGPDWFVVTGKGYERMLKRFPAPRQSHFYA